MGIFVRIQGESAAESKTTFLSIGSPCKVEIAGNYEVAVTVLLLVGIRKAAAGQTWFLHLLQDAIEPVEQTANPVIGIGLRL